MRSHIDDHRNAEPSRTGDAKRNGPPIVGAENDNQGSYDSELRRKTRVSILWVAVRLASNQLFAFIVFVVLARILSPHDIGTFAIVTLFSEFGRILANGGLVNYIARTRTLSPELLDTIYWANMALACVTAATVILLANPVLAALGQPYAAHPLMVVAALLPIVAAGASHAALCMRQFSHKSLAIRTAISGTCGGGAAIVAAYFGWGIWSLVVQRVVTEILNTFVSWQAYRWTPGRKFDLEKLKEVWGFGANMAFAQVIFLFLVRIQDLIIGATIGAAAVGIYRTAWRMTELVTNGAIQPFTTVAIQTFSRLQDNHADLVKAYRSMILASSMVSFPALVGFGVIAPDAVPVIYGSQWVEAGALAQIFALMVVPFTLNYFASPMLSAVGRGADMRTLSILQLSLTLGMTWIAAPYGIVAVACAYVARAYLTFPINLWLLKKRAGIAYAETVRASMPPFLASCLMGAGVWVFMHFARAHFSSPLQLVLVAVVFGFVLYASLLPAISADARRMLMRRFAKRRSGGGGDQ
ncbi:lipopolysaccharide biosynthesis protein [Dongia sp.]|uniref:lipopolysaccharide biosynthesis protein n=1 Tax=Dongia sp. TaxID=1977262 RepID=UPI0035B2F3FD